jgi:uncharacterized protein YciW
MDVAGELAKCRESATALVGMYAPTFLSHAHKAVFTERAATALLAARADALREFATPYWERNGPGPAHQVAEELAREVRNRRARGL